MFPRSIAKNPIAYSTIAAFATLKDLDRNSVRSRTGSGWREERRHEESTGEDTEREAPERWWLVPTPAGTLRDGEYE